MDERAWKAKHRASTPRALSKHLSDKRNGKVSCSITGRKKNGKQWEKERKEANEPVYKDVCNPITAEFREELYGEILSEYEKVQREGQKEKQQAKASKPPMFKVIVTPFEREGSNIRGLARIYFEDSFLINNVNILQGKDKVFVSMPSYKTKQKDENDKDIYQDICYPVTKEFREKLYGEIERVYEEERQKKQSRENCKEKEKQHDGFVMAEEEQIPFR